jgi:ABC-type oligopeptide transport system ATPase subunit
MSYAHEGYAHKTSVFKMKLRMIRNIIVGFLIAQVAVYVAVWYWQYQGDHALMIKYYIAELIHELLPAYKLNVTVDGFDYHTTAQRLVGFMRRERADSMYEKHIIGLFASFLVYLLLPFVYRFFSKKGKELHRNHHIRGSLLISDRDLSEQIRDEKTPLGIILNRYIAIPTFLETRHFLIVGKTGSGKTQLFGRVIQQLKSRKAGMVLYDMKGDFIEKFYDSKHDVIFNPLDKRCVGWNFFNEFSSITELRSIIASFMPYDKNQDKFWVDGARDVFLAIVLYCYLNGMKKNKYIWQICNSGQAELLKIVKETDGAEVAIQRLEEPRQAAGILSTMMQYAKTFQVLGHVDGDFSFKKWVRDDLRGAIFLSNNENHSDVLRPVISLGIELMAKQLLSLSDSMDRRLYFFLDEFGSLQPLQSMLLLMNASRSKGGSVWLATQDLDQIQRTYDRETAHSIVNACSTAFIFALEDPTAREYFARKIGEAEIKEVNDTVTVGSSDSKDGQSMVSRIRKEYVILPSEFGQLPDLYFIVKMHNFDPARSVLERISMPAVNEKFEEVEHFTLDKMTRSNQPKRSNTIEF